MRKFWAVVKREYVQRVRTKMFILTTVLAPLIISLFVFAPALIFSIKAGGPVRIAVVDETGKTYGSLYNTLYDADDSDDFDKTDALDSFQKQDASEGLQQSVEKRKANVVLEEVRSDGKSLNELRTELDQRLRAKDLDGYLILPANLLSLGKAEFFGRNTGDLFTRRALQKALNQAVREQRMREAKIDVRMMKELAKPVALQSLKVGTTGEERDSGEGFILVFGVGFIMYLTILMYGQVVLGAMIEEKETRIAEILFSSVKPFTLMTGKLVGVALVALTQLAIWGLATAVLVFSAAGAFSSSGTALRVPKIPAINFLFFVLFFLLGYFIYSTLYALIGSMVTTAQEGGQLAMPIILMLVVGFYLFYPVISSPDSSFAFWVSMFPFFAPITMLVRIVTQTPPFWEIALSLVIGWGSVALITWFSARIYRVGMLMYGKKASIPEAWRWVRQA